ncbi:hypothetical protein PT277_05190 [Acetobacteraceae bacterium ESL0709]|nr:hypothetical protein [Acetobacteraceae bacterium ESL0709]
MLPHEEAENNFVKDYKKRGIKGLTENMLKVQNSDRTAYLENGAAYELELLDMTRSKNTPGKIMVLSKFIMKRKMPMSE